MSAKKKGRTAATKTVERMNRGRLKVRPTRKGKAAKKAKAEATNGEALSAKVLEKALSDLSAGVVGVRELGISLGFVSGAPLRRQLREQFGADAYARAIAEGREARAAVAKARKGAAPDEAPAKKGRAKKGGAKKGSRRAAKKS